MAACTIDRPISGRSGAVCAADPYESQVNSSTSLCDQLIIRFCRRQTDHASTTIPSCCFFRNRGSSLQEEEEECVEHDLVWLKIREEALLHIEREPLLSELYYKTILSHHSLESALAFHLANKLCDPISLSNDALYQLFLEALDDHAAAGGIKCAIRYDLKAWKDRDPACQSYVHCFLNLKGFSALQAQRIAHEFWVQGRKMLAVIVQSRVSEVFGVDIHPGARIGRGIVLDHATGVVIGESAVIGDDVTVLHDVTLGGRGKVGGGDRHPKMGDGAVIGAGAGVLGNIRVGDGAKVGASSVVLKDVCDRTTTVVGNPAQPASQPHGWFLVKKVLGTKCENTSN